MKNQLSKKKSIALLFPVLCVAYIIFALFHYTVVFCREAAERNIEYKTPMAAASPVRINRSEKENQNESIGENSAKIEISTADLGYVTLTYRSEEDVKVSVKRDEEERYWVTIKPDGSDQIIPLTAGSGTYKIAIYERTAESRYSQRKEATVEVSLINEFYPYMIPCFYCDYSGDTACVQKAAEIAETCKTQEEFIEKIQSYVCDTLSYDREKSNSITRGYVPDLDEIFISQKGICGDYASMTAAMLRSCGIPTKIIFGNVVGHQEQHAWNEVYLPRTGWVRVDTCFSDGGATPSYIDDDNNYDNKVEL